MSTAPSKNLETFPNPQPNRDYLIHIEIPEFTSLCPLTGQPDFATLLLDYIPDQKNVELKALKLYMWSYRQEGAFHEAITNKILDDLVAAGKDKELIWSCSSVGSVGYFFGANFALENGMQNRVLPCAGGAEAVTNLMGGQVDYAVV